MLHHTVTLPPEHMPEFPSECVACGAPEPAGHIALADRAFVTWSLWIPLAHFMGKKVTRRVPACRRCARIDAVVKWSRLIAACALVWLGVQLLHPWVQSIEFMQPVRRLSMLVASLPALVVIGVWWAFFPRAVTLYVRKKSVDYDFGRRDYAEAFAQRNGTFVSE